MSMVVLSIVRGWLVPRSQVDAILREKQAQLEEKDRTIADREKQRDDWRATAHSERAVSELALRNQDRLMAAADTANRMLEALSTTLKVGG